MFDAIWSSPGASLRKFSMQAFGAESVKPTHLAGNAPWLHKLEEQAAFLRRKRLHKAKDLHKALYYNAVSKTGKISVTGDSAALKKSGAYPELFGKAVIYSKYISNVTRSCSRARACTQIHMLRLHVHMSCRRSRSCSTLRCAALSSILWRSSAYWTTVERLHKVRICERCARPERARLLFSILDERLCKVRICERCARPERARLPTTPVKGRLGALLPT